MIPFHLALPVTDLALSKQFYVELLQACVGRETERWIDINFFGHQLSLHVCERMPQEPLHNLVDGKHVPVRHFGAILPWELWHQLAEKLRDASVDFIIEPYIRFEGQVGEQATMFLLDPSGNALEFKSFKDETQIFAA